mmetsp:Transcript_10837/g.27468  ORF Transcript_10837/g.27468 Transcript_10837/m.27468 type:complete len:210 (-) Transcript_10837:250-879(-)
MLEHGCGTDNENSFDFATCCHRAQEGCHLDCFSQPHFISKDPPRLLAMEFPHPLQTRALVGKESIVYPGWNNQSSIVFFLTGRNFVPVALVHHWHLFEAVIDPFVHPILVVFFVPIVQRQRPGIGFRCTVSFVSGFGARGSSGFGFRSGWLARGDFFVVLVHSNIIFQKLFLFLIFDASNCPILISSIVISTNIFLITLGSSPFCVAIG